MQKEVSAAELVDENGNAIMPEYQISKEPLVNVFKSGFNFYAPQFRKLEVYPYQQDNYATRVDSFVIQKCFNYESLTLEDNWQ